MPHRGRRRSRGHQTRRRRPPPAWVCCPPRRCCSSSRCRAVPACNSPPSTCRAAHRCRPRCCAPQLPLPELSEAEVVRHFTNTSRRNFSVDQGFYPLGSCTMKYNPKINDRVADLPGLAIDPPVPGRSDGAGSVAPALGVAAVAGRDRGVAGGVPATVGGRPRRVDRRADHSRVPPGARPAAHHHAGARLRARHQSGYRRHGRLPVAHRAHRRRRQPRLRRPAGRSRRRRRRVDDHQPEHARACSNSASPTSPRRYTTPAGWCTWTAPT